MLLQPCSLQQCSFNVSWALSTAPHSGWLQRSKVAKWSCNLSSTCCFLHLHPKKTATFSGYILFLFKHDSLWLLLLTAWGGLGSLLLLWLCWGPGGQSETRTCRHCAPSARKTAPQVDCAACPILTSVDSPPCNTEHMYINKSLKGAI